MYLFLSITYPGKHIAVSSDTASTYTTWNSDSVLKYDHLACMQVTNVLVLDENPEGLEGPWVTYARMVTLRTNKALTGPDLGVPSLTFQAFYEAKYGDLAWEPLDKIPKEEWMAYLIWYRCAHSNLLPQSVEKSCYLSSDGYKPALQWHRVCWRAIVQAARSWLRQVSQLE